MSDTNPKITTIGSATQDIFLEGTSLTAKRDVRTHDFVEQFPLGSKLEIDDIVFATGGGAMNAAVTFGRQNLATGFWGKIGQDPAGEAIMKCLDQENIDSQNVAYDDRYATAYSTLLVAPRGERVVLVYRGASRNLKINDFDLNQLQADWLYITTLGNLDLLEALLDYAQKENIKIATDLGTYEYAKPERIKSLINQITLLKGNKEELGSLFAPSEAEPILREAVNHCEYVVVTDGPNGSWVTDGDNLLHAGQYQDVPVVDRTGAGDAFGSGLVAKLAQGKSLREAITFGSANATSVVQSVGAKTGILGSDEKLKDMEIEVRPL